MRSRPAPTRSSTEPALPRLPLALLRRLLPRAERDEVLADIRAEYVEIAASHGLAAARQWLWRQALGSTPALLGWNWWRGWTGFEPRANAYRPGGSMLKTWIADARYAVRRLRARPTYTILSILTLALGIVTGASNVRIVQTNLLKPLPFREPFDVVIVDAPCSGLGTLRRDPDIRWRRHEDELTSLAGAELTMLQHAAQVVSPGGRLVYATCSSEPDENDGVVSAFLATTPGFRIVDARTAAPALAAEVVDASGFLRTEPHRHGLEAFFGAVLEREL